MSFLNPFFLFATAAALLPVVFHLVRRMKAKTVPFSSLMFLKATPQEIIRKRRLRDILLMALRVALFALLALVFARPFLPSEHLPFVPQQEDQSVVLLVDNSYSMQHGDRFAAARAEVLRRLDEAGPRDEFAIVAFSDEVEPLTRWDSERALHRDVAETALQVSNRPTDFYAALRLAEELLQEARNPTRAVVLISDFQQNGFTNAMENWKLDPDVAFVPARVGEEEADNAYVQDFTLSQQRAGEEVALQFHARVAAQGEAGERAAALFLDGTRVRQQSVPGGASRTVSFQETASREGYHQGHLALGDDPLPIDNAFYFTYGVAGQPSLLFVSEGGSRDAFFLERAFDLGEEARYATTTTSRPRLNRTALRRHDAVFLTDVSGLSGGQRQELRSYVEAGGGLILSVGEGSDLQGLSNLLETLGVGRADRTVDARAEQRYEAIIGEVDLRHPAFEVFAASGTGAMLRPKFRRYIRIEPDTNAVVVGTYDTGDPFLLERQLGSGRVLVYTSTFDTEWTDLPIQELFIPLVYGLADYARSGSGRQHLFTVGEAVSWEGLPGAEWEVRAPGDRLYRVTVDDRGKAFFRETEAPGHYVAAHGTERYPFSVNVDPRESDLDARDAEEVYAAVVPPAENTAATPEQAAALVLEDEEQRQKLWRYLLFLVLGLYVLETFLANRRPSLRRPDGKNQMK